MPLIKASRTPPATRHASVIDLTDLHDQAQAEFDAIRVEADRVLADARAQADAINERGERQGYEEGYATGLAEGRATGAVEAREELRAEMHPQISALIDGWREAIDAWSGQRETFLDRARDDALALAIRMGEKIALRAIEVDPAIVRGQLREAVELAGRPSRAVVCVHPEDREVLIEWLPNLLSSLDESAKFEVRDDETVARGGCVLRTAGGEVDAAIDTQLERIAATLMPARSVQAGATET